MNDDNETNVYEVCPICEGEDDECVWCEDSGWPGMVEHACDTSTV